MRAREHVPTVALPSLVRARVRVRVRASLRFWVRVSVASG